MFIPQVNRSEPATPKEEKPEKQGRIPEGRRKQEKDEESDEDPLPGRKTRRGEKGGGGEPGGKTKRRRAQIESDDSDRDDRGTARYWMPLGHLGVSF